MKSSSRAFTPSLLIFVVSFLFLFLSMSRIPIIHDEGFTVTAAMRIMAGQMPHRDFYVNYGPAQFYLLAGLFKVFGRYLIVERISDTVLKSALIGLLFAIVSPYCSRLLAFAACGAALLWVSSLDVYASILQPVCLLNLICGFLILPAFTDRISNRRLFAIGALSGLGVLFRYDTGAVIVLIGAVCLLVAAWVRDSPSVNPGKVLAKTACVYFLGCLAVVLPALAYFLSVSPMHGFVFDIIEYPSKNYHKGRNLPFPPLHLRHLGDLGVYIPVLIGLLALLVAVAQFRRKGNYLQELAFSLRSEGWRAFLLIFGAITTLMYLKGIVRVTPSHMYLGIIPSLLLIAVLLERRSQLPASLRMCVFVLAVLSVVAPIGSTLTLLKRRVLLHDSLVFSDKRNALESSWCSIPDALTKGLCFRPDDGRIQLIQFLETHTRPDQTLLVANSRNDIVFASDSMMYFSTGRMPATHWSEFDPGLQNSIPIQVEMTHELDANQTPYIVLDSEFETGPHEPNDSDRSSGVLILDKYIQSKYSMIGSFGDFTVWQRKHG